MIKFVGYLFFEEKNSSHILFAYQLKQYADPQKTKKKSTMCREECRIALCPSVRQ